MLLGFEAVHLGGQLGGRDEVGQVNEFPALELGAVAEVEVLGEGVVLPAAAALDAGAPPEAGRAVEIEEAPGAAAGGLLEHEVAVEEHGLDAGEERVGAVEVAPAGLDHADPGIGEEMDGLREQIRRRAGNRRRG